MAVFLTVTGLALIFEYAHVKAVKIDLRSVLKILLVVVIAITLLIASWNILRIALSTDIPIAIVKSRSMYPTLDIGDIVIVKGSRDYMVGDVIVFRYGREIVVHRIFNITGRGIVTKGDANEKPDPWIISYSDIYGKVIAIIPRIGYIVLALSNPPVLLMLMALVMIIPILKSITFVEKSDICPFTNEKCRFGGFNPKICQICLMAKQLQICSVRKTQEV
jgi:signal peptidase